MSIKEAVALKTIVSITSQWAKMIERLDKAMNTLKIIISSNKEKIVELEGKNEELLETINQTEAFKSNLQKMYTSKS